MNQDDLRGRRANRCVSCKAECDGARCEQCRAKQADRARKARAKAWKPGQPSWSGWEPAATEQARSRYQAPAYLVCATHTVWGPDLNGNFYSRCRGTVLRCNGWERATFDTGIVDQTDGSRYAMLSTIAKKVAGQDFAWERELVNDRAIVVDQATITVARKGDL